MWHSEFFFLKNAFYNNSLQQQSISISAFKIVAGGHTDPQIQTRLVLLLTSPAHYSLGNQAGNR